ncbi:MAG: hypothetical protein ACLQSR_09055, partial [Limisphaerales bacterium]
MRSEAVFLSGLFRIAKKERTAEDISMQKDYSHWQSYPPFVLYDNETNSEWVFPETPRYYVAKTNKWFICDRY